MRYSELLESSIINEARLTGTYYHGSKSQINKFTDEFVGKGADQFGPGIYFTSNKETAIGYANGGFVYTVELSLRNTIDADKAVNDNIIQQMIDRSPDENAYTNWDENEVKAKFEALKAYRKEDNMYDALMSVWYDWYNSDPVDFVREMVKIGYDGYVYNHNNDEDYVIVYNPQSITITKTEKL